MALGIYTIFRLLIGWLVGKGPKLILNKASSTKATPIRLINEPLQ